LDAGDIRPAAATYWEVSLQDNSIRARKVLRLHQLPNFLGLQRSQINELVKVGLLHPFKPYPSARAQVVLEDEIIELQKTGMAAAKATAVAAEPASLTKANKHEPTPEPRRMRKPARATAVEPTLTA
jgi:hypothetical protein